MTTQQIESTQNNTIDTAAGLIVRYGLVIVLAWYGGLKSMRYEADSPLMSWVYDVFSVSTFSALLGVFEIGAAVLLAVKPWWPKVSVGGSLLAIALRLDHKFHVHHHRGIRGFTRRIPGAVAYRWLPDERHCAAGYLRVDPVRRGARAASLA
jgi:hypothetical protein